MKVRLPLHERIIEGHNCPFPIVTLRVRHRYGAGSGIACTGCGNISGWCIRRNSRSNANTRSSFPSRSGASPPDDSSWAKHEVQVRSELEDVPHPDDGSDYNGVATSPELTS